MNDLKARQQDKDTTICKLKDIIKSMREKSKDENVNTDLCELATKNVELENNQFDSIKTTRVRNKEQSDSLINQLNLKSAENKDLRAQIQDKVFVITSLKNNLRKIKGKETVANSSQIPSVTTIAPGMFNLDLEPLAPKLLQNRDAHIDYLRTTQKHANILWEIVEQAKEKQPLDYELDFACMYATRIQELLIYVHDTCPNVIKPSAKKVVITPLNKVKKVRFVEPLTSSNNTKQVELSKTSDSNTPVLSSTGVKCSTSHWGSKPTGNKKNDRISQKPSRNMKNKVEAQPRKVNKKNCVVKPISDADVKHACNTNSVVLCGTCNKSMFDGVHDKCLLDFVKNGNNRVKSAKKYKTKNVWKTTGHVFTDVGYKWKPTCKTFTIVGNSCPLTRITSTNVVQIVLWYLDSGCSKHMTGNRSQLMNFVSKFLEGLGHNLFYVGQFFDADLEVAFRKNTCFVRNLEGVDLLSGSKDINLYTISLDDILKSTLICLLSKASKTKSWLWHRRLSHLNFACALGKSKKSSHKPKTEDTNHEKLYLLHMDFCGPMRVASINSKRYILVIVDDYSRFTWVRFLKKKDEAPAAIIKCIKNIQVCLKATVQNVRTDNGTEFVNQTLHDFYEYVSISHQTSVARTPQQNGIVKRRNQTLVEAARTMLIFSKAPLFLWAEAINTACYTQNRSLIHKRYNKTPYELMQDKKPDLSFLHVFGALYYPTNDNTDLGKFDAKEDIRIFIGYTPAKKAF
ncbi:retrovirus-related pol polyprotein from transposon TNT 1-94 [Tanacetum coccineum]